MWADFRYSARSLTRSPGWALPLLLTIALGIGSNASVQGFVRGSLTPDLPLAGIETLVSLFALDVHGAAGPLTHGDYLTLRDRTDLFEEVGAIRESQDIVVLDGRTRLMSVAVVSPEAADLLRLPLRNGACLSDRVWHSTFRSDSDAQDQRLQLGGRDVAVSGAAPEWLAGLYAGRDIDVWMPIGGSSGDIGRSSHGWWVLARLREGVSIEQAQIALQTMGVEGGTPSLLPYTGLTPQMASGIIKTHSLLRAAAAAVFLIACANVAAFLLARSSARSQETSVRVALGAGRGQLVRQLLADCVLISVAGGAVGVLLAIWTAQIIPALFFVEDADHLVFAPDRTGIVSIAVACVVVTVACGLLPLFELRHDNPAAVLQRESAGPSKTMQRVRAGLVVVQMTCCAVLVIASGLLIDGFNSVRRTHEGRRLGHPVLVSAQASEHGTRAQTAAEGLKYFAEIEQRARAKGGVLSAAWLSALPGIRPAWQSVQVQAPPESWREVTIDVALITGATLDHIVLPPLRGRMFGGADTADCKVAVVNEQASAALFAVDSVGQTVEDPAGQDVQIIGVVRTRVGADSEPPRPTIYYYAEHGEPPLGRLGPGRFRVPVRPPAGDGFFDAAIVSPTYFDALGFVTAEGTVFGENQPGRGCRIAVVNQQAAEMYFAGRAVGGAVIDSAGRRTQIIGVVRSAQLRAAQRRVEPAMYLPLSQDFLPRMTVLLALREADTATLNALRLQLAQVPGSARPIEVTTLDDHLARTALAPERIAAVLVGASAATALTLGVIGLYGVMADATRRRQREFALRIALGAKGWRIVQQVMTEGGRLVGAGTVAGMLASFLVARWIAQITPNAALSVTVWLAAPLVLAIVVLLASVLPARRALGADPLTIMRDT